MVMVNEQLLYLLLRVQKVTSMVGKHSLMVDGDRKLSQFMSCAEKCTYS